MDTILYKSCCFIGHRKINEAEEIKNNLRKVIKTLIEVEMVDSFYFGSKSQFDDLCYKIVTDVKREYSHIKRIYVRSSFQDVPDWYEKDLLNYYEYTYFPEHIKKAGRASYVERNQEMINKSDFCVVYYDENYLPPRRKNSRRDLTDYQPKSGTAVAYNYAIKKEKKIINVF